MLNDLDKTLRALLVRDVAALDEERVSFEAPGPEFKPSIPAVNLFLYDVRENRDLRSNDWQLERRENMVRKQRDPRRVDCSYLLTAWAGDTMSEHLLLGQVMRALLRNAVIAGDLLQGSLQGQALPTSILQPGSLQSLGEFWQALGNRPRAALNYTVTVAIDIFKPVEVPAVEERIFHTGRKIGGAGQAALAEGSHEQHIMRIQQQTSAEVDTKEE